MEHDQIIEVGIDSKERLYVKPAKMKSPYMYREAVEVNWSESNSCLYSPKPRSWTYLEWYIHILGAAKLQACELHLTDKTIWNNVSTQLKNEILNSATE